MTLDPAIDRMRLEGPSGSVVKEVSEVFGDFLATPAGGAVVGGARINPNVSYPAGSAGGRLNERVTPTNWGALFDGSGLLLGERYVSLAQAQTDLPHATDLADTVDTATIHEAIKDLPAGGTVILPPGVGILNRSVLIDGIPVNLQGSGAAWGNSGINMSDAWGTTLWLADNVDEPALVIQHVSVGDISSRVQCTISELTINGNRANNRAKADSKTAAPHGIVCRGARGVRFFNVHVLQCAGHGMYLTTNDAGVGCNNVYGLDIEIRYCDGDLLNSATADSIFCNVVLGQGRRVGLRSGGSRTTYANFKSWFNLQGARGGGIGNSYPGSHFYDNYIMGFELGSSSKDPNLTGVEAESNGRASEVLVCASGSGTLNAEDIGTGGSSGAKCAVMVANTGGAIYLEMRLISGSFSAGETVTFANPTTLVATGASVVLSASNFYYQTVQIDYTNLGVAKFQDLEPFSTPSSTGIITRAGGYFSGTHLVIVLSGTPGNTEVMTGGTSGATCTLSASPSIPLSSTRRTGIYGSNEASPVSGAILAGCGGGNLPGRSSQNYGLYIASATADIQLVGGAFGGQGNNVALVADPNAVLKYASLPTGVRPSHPGMMMADLIDMNGKNLRNIRSLGLDSLLTASISSGTLTVSGSFLSYSTAADLTLTDVALGALAGLPIFIFRNASANTVSFTANASKIRTKDGNDVVLAPASGAKYQVAGFIFVTSSIVQHIF